MLEIFVISTCINRIQVGLKKVRFRQVSLYIYIYIVKPVLRGHLWDKEKVVF
jgi:hypothetical protein